MATHHGRLREFHPESDSIKAYLEQVSLYFAANTVEEERQVAVLLSSTRTQTYSLLCNLVAPDHSSTSARASLFPGLLLRNSW